MTCPNNDWVFVSRVGNTETIVYNKNIIEVKLATVSSFMETPILHLRDFHGEHDLKLPLSCGVSMSKEGFMQLIALKEDILKAFERLEMLQDKNTKS